MTSPQALAIAALTAMKTDDTIRLRTAFKSKSKTEMQQPYGDSGQTCQEILDRSIECDRKIDEAIQWVKRAKL